MEYYILMHRIETSYQAFFWDMEFSDYDKEVVKEEMQALRDSGTKKKDLKIITAFSDEQCVVEETVYDFRMENE